MTITAREICISRPEMMATAGGCCMVELESSLISARATGRHAGRQLRGKRLGRPLTLTHLVAKIEQLATRSLIVSLRR
jgi:hypothetical protein